MAIPLAARCATPARDFPRASSTISPPGTSSTFWSNSILTTFGEATNRCSRAGLLVVSVACASAAPATPERRQRRRRRGPLGSSPSSPRPATGGRRPARRRGRRRGRPPATNVGANAPSAAERGRNVSASATGAPSTRTCGGRRPSARTASRSARGRETRRRRRPTRAASSIPQRIRGLPAARPSATAPASIVTCAQAAWATVCIVELVKNTVTGHNGRPERRAARARERRHGRGPRPRRRRARGRACRGRAAGAPSRTTSGRAPAEA